jgi:hypothetical protein
VSREADEGLRAAAPRPKVRDFAEGHRLAAEADRLEASRDQRLATAVFWSDRPAGDELFGELE